MPPRKTYRRLICSMLLASMVLVVSAPALAAPQRVAILPFTANSKEDISYLVRGVRDMLASRLAWGDKVVVMEPDLVAGKLKGVKQPYSEKTAREIGKSLHADAVVFGSITSMGKSVSVDARVVRTNDDGQALTAFVQASSLDQVIPQVSNFAQRINADIFARPQALAARSKAAQPAQKAGGAGGSGGDLIEAPASPASQWGERGSVNVDKLPPNISPLNPLFLRQLTGVESDRYWRSPRINGTITSLAVADIDMDGKNEILACLPNSLRVYRLEGPSFVLLTEFKNGPKGKYLFVDTADIDGDGRPEIFVSNVNDQDLQSFVLVWREGGLRMQVKGLGYYLRIQPNPLGKGHILFGQQNSMTNPYYGPVYRMKFEGGTYVPDKPQELPEFGNIYNFALADLNGSGYAMTLMIGPGDTLRVYRGKEELYKSGEVYGLSGKFLVAPAGSTVDSTGDEEVWHFLPTRIVLNDLDGDGRTEVVVVQNKDSLGTLFEKMRFLYRGTIFSLFWNGMSMVENWRTPRISGNLTDYVIADAGNVGRPALVLSVVKTTQEGWWQKGYGHIVAFTLKAAAKKTPAKPNKGL